MRKFISQDRFEIPYTIVGAEKGPWLMCVNAIMETINAWRPVVSRLAPEGFRIILFDIPATKRAKIMTGPPKVTVIEKVQILKDVIEKVLEDEGEMGAKVNLLSSSWGSMVCAKFVEMYPHMVNRVMLGSFGLTINDALFEIQEQVEKAVSEGKPEEVADILFRTFAQGLSPQMQDLIRKSFTYREKIEWEVFFNHMKEFRSIENAAKIVNFQSIKNPVMWINGLDDIIVNLDEIPKLVASMPNSHFIMVKNVGHFMHFQNPKAMEIFVDFFLGRGYRPIPGLPYIVGNKIECQGSSNQ